MKHESNDRIPNRLGHKFLYLLEDNCGLIAGICLALHIPVDKIVPFLTKLIF